jgi:hypothetical protein
MFSINMELRNKYSNSFLFKDNLSAADVSTGLRVMKKQGNVGQV